MDSSRSECTKKFVLTFITRAALILSTQCANSYLIDNSVVKQRKPLRINANTNTNTLERMCVCVSACNKAGYPTHTESRIQCSYTHTHLAY